ncbi:hypothetical protein GCM10007385_17940 [Tateyamaria omphalii]|uniref:hypothetical protein n=1 Tax=Tateyamaria omphalii TaxID=299262 RepID=UPI001672B0C9|nr:hypothetical protein [Tateyamaria omphalii]GGX50009.1 hypothetical protein GCM10007385_17940 [Tateyamaria omphalii]
MKSTQNPHHKQAHLVGVTVKGKHLYDDAIAIQTHWVNDLSKGLSPADIETAQDVINVLKERLLAASTPDSVRTSEN